MSRAAHWTTISRRSLLRGGRWLEVFRETVQLPDGRRVEDFYTLRMPDFVVVVAITSSGKAIVERHYKHGSGSVIWDLPAGHIENGERPLAAAKRELLEETGYAARRWTELGSFVANANRGCGVGHFFLAEGCTHAGMPSSDDLEDTQVHLVAPSRLPRLARRPRVPMSTPAAVGLAHMHLLERGGSWPIPD